MLESSGGSIKTGPFGTKLSASEYSARGAPVISVGEVGYGAIRVTDKTKRVGEDITTRMPEYLLEPGDIVFGRKGAVDRSAWVRPHEQGYFLGSDGIRLRFGNAVDSRFMAYQLQSSRLREWLLQHAVGTTLASLNEPTLKAVPVVVPPIDEQRGIAATLGALDDKIESNRRVQQHASELVDALARQMLGTNVTHSVELSELVDFNRLTLRPGVAEAAVLYVDIASVSLGRVDAVTQTTWGAAPSRARRGVSDGDVLYSTVRPSRRSFAQVLDPDERTVVSTGFAVMSPTPAIGSSLLTTVSASLKFAAYLESVAHGSAYPAVSVAAMGNYLVEVLVDNAVVAAFGATTMPLRRRAHHAEQENRGLARLRDTLLPEFLSGRIRVPEAQEVVGEAVG